MPFTFLNHLNDRYFGRLLDMSTAQVKSRLAPATSTLFFGDTFGQHVMTSKEKGEMVYNYIKTIIMLTLYTYN